MELTLLLSLKASWWLSKWMYWPSIFWKTKIKSLNRAPSVTSAGNKKMYQISPLSLSLSVLTFITVCSHSSCWLALWVSILDNVVLGVSSSDLGPCCTQGWSTVCISVWVGRVASSKCWSGGVLREGRGGRCANAAKNGVQGVYVQYRLDTNLVDILWDILHIHWHTQYFALSSQIPLISA